MKRQYVWLLFLTICLCSCLHDDHNISPTGVNLSVGDVVPQFQLRLCIPDPLDWRVASVAADGTSTPCTTVSMADQKGKRVYLLFFNTSCQDCQRELPRIQRMYEEHRTDSNYVFMAIAREQARKSIEEYWLQNNITLPYSEQGDRVIYNLFASEGIPRLYVVDERGVIVELWN